jgi:hypothetical protein
MLIEFPLLLRLFFAYKLLPFPFHGERNELACDEGHYQTIDASDAAWGLVDLMVEILT